MAKFNDIQLIKRQIYAMRNGVVAQALRDAGSPHRLIMGVNIPQLAEIARNTGYNEELARLLWNDTPTRESMLIAPMLFPPDKMTYEEAAKWLETAVDTESTDILCHRLLRKLPFAYELAVQYADSPAPLLRYGAMRILWHFIAVRPQDIKTLATREFERNNNITKKLAAQTLDEISFMELC